MPHRTLSTTNDYKRKLTMIGLIIKVSNPLIFSQKNAKNRTIVTAFVLPNKMYSKPIKIARMTFKTQ